MYKAVIPMNERNTGIISYLEDEQIGRLFKALFEYYVHGNLPDFLDDTALYVAFDAFDIRKD